MPIWFNAWSMNRVVPSLDVCSDPIANKMRSLKPKDDLDSGTIGSGDFIDDVSDHCSPWD